MGAKPADLFVGVVEFFSVLLPGAFLTFAFQLLLAPNLSGLNTYGSFLPALQSSSQRWVAFGFSSYLVGHLVFQLGSLLDPTYDKLVRRRRARLSGDFLYLTAKRLKTDTDQIPEQVSNTFKWCISYIRTRNAAAIAVVDSLEASHKFFRSMVIAFLFYAIICLARWCLPLRARLLGLASALILAIVSYWRFAELRWKMTEAAYLYYLELKNHSSVDGTPAGENRAPAAQ